MDVGLDGFLKSLNGLVESINVLNKMLRDDQKYFSLDQADQLQASNEHKQILLHNIAGFTHDLQSRLPTSTTGFLNNLSLFINELPEQSREKALVLLTMLKQKLTEGSRELSVNSHVIHMNLEQIKELWDRLMPFSAVHNSVYEKPKPEKIPEKME